MSTDEFQLKSSPNRITTSTHSATSCFSTRLVLLSCDLSSILPMSCDLQDELYEHFLKNGEYPGPKQTLPPFGRVLWLLRLIVVTWALLLTVLPLVLMYFFLSWQTMSLFLSCCLSGKQTPYVSLDVSDGALSHHHTIGISCLYAHSCICQSTLLS